MPSARRSLDRCREDKWMAIAGLPFPRCAVCDKEVEDWRQHRSYWPPDNPSWTFIATCHGKTEKIVVYDSDLEGQDFFLLADAFSSEVEAITRRR